MRVEGLQKEQSEVMISVVIRGFEQEKRETVRV